MIKTHVLGLPRIGVNRELKKGIEAYWRGTINLNELEAVAKKIKQYNWNLQKKAGLDFVTVGDFSYYDHILDMSALLGVIPQRFGVATTNIDINTYFCMARGQAPQSKETTACEMTKWFNTNYHYIVPEFTRDQKFKISSDKLFKEIDEALNIAQEV